MPKLLYSTVCFLKYYVQKEYFGDIHYVWCSEMFDNTKSPSYSPGSLTAPSSNPAEIYRELKRAVDQKDAHSYKISEQRASIKKLAVDKEKASAITSEQRNEILYMVDHCEFSFWRPLVYVIPNTIKPRRLKSVPIQKRASFGPEYIVADLKSHEFDTLEL